MRIAILFFSCAFGIGCTPANSESPPWNVDLSENACAIQCPADAGTRYAGLGGSVACTAGSTPVCQCTDAARPMAGCELLENPPGD